MEIKVRQSPKNSYSNGFKECLFKFTIKRTEELLDSTFTYSCGYKVDIHREHDIIDDRSYIKNIPPCKAKDSGILLIILLQWDELRQGVGRFMSKPLSQAFYISSEEEEDALRDIISPTIYSLGIRSSEENETITGLLVSSITSLYNENKDIDDDCFPSNWTPVVLDIVPERRVSSEEMGWANKEVDRFCLSYLSTRKKKSAAAAAHDGAAEIEEECCSICLKGEEDSLGCEFIRLPSCSHTFHKDCIIQWLTRSGQKRGDGCISQWQWHTRTKNCPLCRIPVPPALADECPWQQKPGSWMRRFMN